MNTERLNSIVDSFSSAKVGVIGDIVADIYIYGRPDKLSREAPVVVVHFEGEDLVLGSAGNTIHNLAVLGASVYPIVVIGEDKTGRDLSDLMSNVGVNLRGVISSADRHTISKTRIMAGDAHTSKQQVIRIDKENDPEVSGNLEDKVLSLIDELNDEVGAWIVSDYDYDVTTPKVVQRICEIAKEKIVVADSRFRLCDFAGVTVVTPNESEASEASGILIRSAADAKKAGSKLLDEVGCQAVLITRGNEGMMLFQKDGSIEDIPISGSDQITDVTGAGDTVASVMTMSLLSGASFVEAAKLANYAAGVVVMKRGTATLSTEELKGAINI